MGRLKIFENILKAASVLVTALVSVVKFIGMVAKLKTAKA